MPAVGLGIRLYIIAKSLILLGFIVFFFILKIFQGADRGQITKLIFSQSAGYLFPEAF